MMTVVLLLAWVGRAASVDAVARMAPACATTAGAAMTAWRNVGAIATTTAMSGWTEARVAGVMIVTSAWTVVHAADATA